MEPDDEAGGGTVAVPRNALKTWDPAAAPKRLIAELDAR